jgi:hypothetical protein
VAVNPILQNRGNKYGQTSWLDLHVHTTRHWVQQHSNKSTRIRKLQDLFQLLTSKNSYMLKPTRISTSNLYLFCALFWIHGLHYINCVLHVYIQFGILGFKTIFRSLYVASKTVSHLLKLWIEVFMQLKVNTLMGVTETCYLPTPSFTDCL